jgi:quinoprotein relay system zinc metallohydrolase 2
MKKIIFLLTLLFVCMNHLHAALNMIEVKPNVFVHQGQHLDVDEGYQGDICNIGFIIGNKSIAVIDTGGSLTVGNELLKEIRKRSSLPISHVINTHVHLDHIYGNAVFKSEHSEFVGHKNLAKAMLIRKAFYQRLNLELLKVPFKDSVQVPPSIEINEGEILKIDLGDRVLSIEAYPEAHTDSDVTVFDEKTKTLWTGDLLFVERAPVIDGNIHGFIEVVKNLSHRSLDLVVPGHGTPPEDHPKAFKKMQHYLVSLRDAIRQAIDDGIDLDEATQTLLKDQANEWELFNIQNPRNINRVYPSMEWE